MLEFKERKENKLEQLRTIKQKEEDAKMGKKHYHKNEIDQLD